MKKTIASHTMPVIFMMNNVDGLTRLSVCINE